MHEFSIASQIFAQLVKLAAEHSMGKITSVTIQAGRMRQIVPEALDTAFTAVAAGTIADGAALDLEIIEPKALCRVCGHRFRPEIDSYLCEKCNEADVEIVEGNEIIIRTVEYEEEGNE
jgi:hydrogenase nickel incorporation protein HypA/HybF